MIPPSTLMRPIKSVSMNKSPLQYQPQAQLGTNLVFYLRCGHAGSKVKDACVHLSLVCVNKHLARCYACQVVE